ncbi:TetR/AcrR family transcriptional regulator [Streptomyces sp. NPDC088116]|uniref:TetR/AcrR family transcriptional regulator n=1 Tax=Streptomyces sp. NPDC088116 TaxID=3365825 RepID=UPI00382AA565
MRQDAQRNRERILAAAREVYAEQGVEAPLDVIARRADVGNATLYRRFPDRAALIEAVFQEDLAATIEAGERMRGSADPWEGLNGYLERIFSGLATDRGVTDLMTTDIAGVPTLEQLHVHNAETIGGLLARCREDGSVRGDVTVEDVLFTLAALGRAVPAADAVVAGSWRRLLALFLDGLRAEGVRPLPGEPLTSEQLKGALGALGAAGTTGKQEAAHRAGRSGPAE